MNNIKQMRINNKKNSKLLEDLNAMLQQMNWPSKPTRYNQLTNFEYKRTRNMVLKKKQNQNQVPTYYQLNPTYYGINPNNNNNNNDQRPSFL